MIKRIKRSVAILLSLTMITGVSNTNIWASEVMESESSKTVVVSEDNDANDNNQEIIIDEEDKRVETYSNGAGLSFSACEIVLEREYYAYTGAPVIPNVKVYYQGRLLVEGIDYSMTCSNNIEPGYALFHLEGMGDFEYSGYTSGYYIRIASGTLQGGIQWNYNFNTKTLSISGQGPMEDFDDDHPCPWAYCRNDATSIDIGDGITRICKVAFRYFTHIKEVKIPDSVESIGDDAFRDCYELSTIDIGTGLKDIGELCFYEVPITKIIIHDLKQWFDIDIDKNQAFENIYSSDPVADLYLDGTLLSDITVPEGVTTIKSLTLAGLKSLKSVTMSSTVEKIGSGAFSNSANLEKIDLKDTTIIEAAAFNRCASLQSISIPYGTTKISETLFRGCVNLKTVYLPKSLRMVDGEAFPDECPLQDVYYEGSAEEWEKNVTINWGNDSLKNAQMHYNHSDDEHDDSYCGTHAQWSYRNHVLTISGNGRLMNYDDNSQTPWFKYRDDINKVVISEGITGLGENCFSDLLYLEKAELPDSLEKISDGAFLGTALSEIHIPKSVVFIGTNAFDYCYSLVKITVASDNKNYSAMNNILYNKNKTTLIRCLPGLHGNVAIENTVKTIHSHALAQCAYIEKVRIPVATETFEEDSFYECGKLSIEGYKNSKAEMYAVRNHIPFISLDPHTETKYLVSGSCGENVMWGVDSTGTLTIEGSGPMDDYESYYYDPAPWREYEDMINSVKILSGVTHIGNNFVNSMDNISSVELADSVESIGTYAFTGLRSLKNITLSKGVKEIAPDAFQDIYYLEEINVVQDNPYYCSVDGVLYNKAKTTLVKCPQSYQGTLHVANGVETVDSYAIDTCDKLYFIEFPGSLRTLKSNSIINCRNIYDLEFPQGLQNIEERAVRDLYYLSRVSIPSTLNHVRASAFESCYKLSDVYYNGSESNWNSINIEDGNYYLTNATIHYNAQMPLIDISDDSRCYVDFSGDNSYPYSGKAVTPKMIIRDDYRNLIEGEHYTIEYSNNNGPGTGTVRVTGIGYYTGSVELTFNIYADSTGEQDEENQTTWSYSNHVLTISGTGSMDDYREYGERPWSEHAEAITKVVVEDGVTRIGAFAFESLDNLKEVEIGKDIIAVGKGAFQYDSVEAVYISDLKAWTQITFENLKNYSYTHPLNYYPGSLYVNGVSVRNLVLPSDIDKVCAGAFWGVDNIKTVTIPKNITSLEYNSFEVCGNITDVYYQGTEDEWNQVTIGGGNEYILKATLHFCGAEPQIIASGYSGNTQWTLDEEGCFKVTGSGSMRNYDYYRDVPWYQYADQITSIEIAEGVTSVGDYAFYGLENLTDVSMSDSVSKIGECAFKNCTSLETVEMPERLTLLDNSAFYGCSSLKSIVIPEGIYTVWGYAFKNCTSLAKVTLPSTLIKIDEAAFYGCSSLKSIAIPENPVEGENTIIGEFAFKNCSKLKDIILPSTLKQVREAAFYATAIETLDIPEGVTKIGPYAFKNCNNLVTLNLPETVTTIEESAFYGSAMETLVLPDSVTTLGAYSFKGCANLNDVTFSKNLQTIGDSAFYYCTALTGIDLSGCDKLIKIDGYAFKNCTALVDIALPDSLKIIGDSAFYSCTALEEFTVPAYVEAIGEYCFSRDEKLKKVTFTGSAPTIGDGAFSRVTASIYVPEGDSSWTDSVKQNYGGNLTWQTAPSTQLQSSDEMVIEEENISEEKE